MILLKLGTSLPTQPILFFVQVLEHLLLQLKVSTSPDSTEDSGGYNV